MNKPKDLDNFKTKFDKLVTAHKNRIIITSHINPDDDAVSSVLSMWYYLTKIQKIKNTVKILYSNKKVNRWSKISFIENIEFVEEIYNYLEKADLLIILDCQGYHRVSINPEELQRLKLKTIVIDHHKTSATEKYGLTLGYPTIFKSSNAEIMYSLFFSHLKKMDRSIAEILLIGIYGDTGGFRFVSKEQSSAFLCAKQILNKSNVKIDSILAKLESYNVIQLKILSKFLENIKIYNTDNWGCFSVSYITREFANKFTSEQVSNGKAIYGNYQKSIEDTKWGVLIYPIVGNDLQWSLSFRSQPGHPNVRLIAQALDINGGGHDAAAGAKLEDKNLNEKVIINKLLTYLKNNKPTLILT